MVVDIHNLQIGIVSIKRKYWKLSGLDLLKEWRKRNPQIENVVLFVSDSLRWDYTPKKISSQGVTFKTISSGIFTPVSFSSIVTGLSPPHHGVYSFFDRLPKDVDTFFTLFGYNSSFWTENTWISSDPFLNPLYRLFRHKKRTSLKNIKTPFIYIEDEKGGHCPYGWSFSNKEYEEWDCQTFFRDFGRKEEKLLRKKYREGIERSVREFENRMDIIEERNLSDETLIVFLSDHGEFLGEYGGLVSHGFMTAPEVVYVPTVFIHPDLPNNESFEKDGVLRHIDLYPTICDLLNIRVTNEMDGFSLFNLKKLPDLGLTYYVEKGGGNFRNICNRINEVSIWDKDGGYLFREGTNSFSLLLRAMYFTVISRNSLNAIYMRQKLRKSSNALKNYFKVLKNLSKSFIKYGSPSMNEKDAEFIIKNIIRK